MDLDPVPSPAASGKADAVNHPTSMLDSREFKVMLEPSLFQSDPEAAIAELEGDLAAVVDGTELTLDHSFDLDDQRSIRFFDTASSCLLRSHGYSFRERIDSSNVRELTMKFRSQRQWLAEYYGTEADGAEYKLEQDLTPQKSIFSSSTTITDEIEIGTMTDAESVFNGLSIPNKGNSLQVVSDLVVHEDKYKGPEVDLGPKKAKFTVSIWYRGEDVQPWLAELSFKYKLDDTVDADTGARAESLFASMLELDDWKARDSTTKTASVYAATSFCSN